jgi:hypothetical protein
MCFKLGGNRSIQTIHGANDGKYSKTTKPDAEPAIRTQASAAPLKKLISRLLSLIIPTVPPSKK